MERACYHHPGGELLTVAEFLGRARRDYREKGINPYCPACGEIVHVYGAHAVAVVARFDHQNRPDDLHPADDCPLANRGDLRYRNLLPNEWDFVEGEHLRALFFNDENLRTAYSFCHRLCGHGNLTAAQFTTLVRRADRRNVWCYAGIELWVIPYILLTLGDFTATSPRTNTEYGFHFFLDKPRRTAVDALWMTPNECTLVKRFSRNNEQMIGANNPCPLSPEQLIAVAGDTAWVTGPLLQALRNAERR